jgi:cytochrome c peroxidase/PKD repeat protein
MDGGLDGSDADASEDAEVLDAVGDAMLPALSADAGPSRYATVGETVILDGSASTGATRYRWSFGNGEGWPADQPNATAEVVYAAPGRYRAVLTVRDDVGNRRTDGVVISVTHPAVHAPRSSSPLTVTDDGRVIVVSPDSDELVVFSASDGALTEMVRRPTAPDPRTVAVWGDRVAVVCQGSNLVELHPFTTKGAAFAVAMPASSRPFGAVLLDDVLWVSLQATGQIARVERDGAFFRRTAVEDVLPDARGVAALPDGRIAVTRWRSPDDGAEIAAFDPATSEVVLWRLAVDPRPGSDTESGGVPSYLEQLAVSPTGDIGLVPSLQAAIGEGLFRSPRPLTHETTVRAIISFVDVASGDEDFEARKLFDDRGFAAAATFTSRGDFAFIAMRGARGVERFDVLTGNQAGSMLDVGFAPDALALSPDDRYLYVNASLSREVVVYDVSDFSTLPAPVTRAPITTSEPLAAEVLAGERLFNDSLDTRLGRDGYIACAHCHLEGMGDQRTWDFTDRGEGLRNTIDLRGRAGTGHGPLHWSANYDEVQDFEHDIRGPFAGTGLMRDEDFESGTRSEPLGDPKATVSRDLDALAAYVTSLDTYLPSPHREDDGSLPAAAIRGREIFIRPSLGCTTCHAGAALTDSELIGPTTPRLHDVGTLSAGSGGRLGAPLTGLDTPTLHGLWQSAPYLHDGRAETIEDVLTADNSADLHGVTSGLTASEVDDLVAYLLCLDGRVD